VAREEYHDLNTRPKFKERKVGPGVCLWSTGALRGERREPDLKADKISPSHVLFVRSIGR